MSDHLPPERRSWNMSRIRSINTKPELVVRRFLHSKGYRFRIHRKDLPGKPDVVLPKYNTVVFIHGCFWHRHKNCRYCSTPKTNQAFWEEKFRKNIERDRINIKKLESTGWNVIVIWECEVKDESFQHRLLEMLQINQNT